MAATIATSQQDIKKVLAFSTVSQIGYMVLAVGTGAYVAAIFLMVAHAFYKGLLFLGAGSVIHGLRRRAGPRNGWAALRQFLPWTYVTFLVGWLAIAGVPPLVGVLGQGRRARQRLRQEPGPVGGRRRSPPCSPRTT